MKLTLIFTTGIFLATVSAFAQDRHSHLARQVRAAAKADCAKLASLSTPKTLETRSWTRLQGCGNYYTVQTGDTCSSVLDNSKSSLTIAEFKIINPIIDFRCWNLQIGTSYCIDLSPCVSKAALNLRDGCTAYARTRRNDTYRALAERNRVSLPTLRKLNPKAGAVHPYTFYCLSNIHKALTDSPSSPIPVARPVVSSTKSTEEPKVKQESETVLPTKQQVEQIATPDSTFSEPQTTPVPTSAEPKTDNGGGNSYLTGDMTFFEPGLGSCGWYNSSNQMIAAAAASLYDKTGDSICGQWVDVELNGKSVSVQIVDKCPPCTIGSLDLSPAAFQKLASLSVGRTQMRWNAASLGSSALRSIGL